MINIEAFQIAEALNIKKIRSDFKATIHASNNSELFYYFEKEDRYLYLFDYGVVVFGNFDAIGISDFLKFVRDYAQNWLENMFSEEYQIHADEQHKKITVKNDKVYLADYNLDAIRIVMLNTGQSCALEYYETLTDEMLASTKVFTLQLEQKGGLSVSRKQLLKYIGRVLNVKNSIVDNLYILDDPSIVWDDDDLGYLNRSLKSNFDTNSRFKDLDYRLKSIEENLKLFTDLLQQRESYWLEIIIIVLILIEVLNIFIGRH